MKAVKKAFSALSLTMALILVVPLMIPQTAMIAEAATIKLNKTKATVDVGKTLQLKMKGTTKKVTWSSEDKTIATVNKSGKVTGVKTGTTNIRAKVGKKTYKCAVTVKFNSADAEKNISSRLIGTCTSPWNNSCTVYMYEYTNTGKYPIEVRLEYSSVDNEGYYHKPEVEMDEILVNPGKTVIYNDRREEGYTYSVKTTYCDAFDFFSGEINFFNMNKAALKQIDIELSCNGVLDGGLDDYSKNYLLEVEAANNKNEDISFWLGSTIAFNSQNEAIGQIHTYSEFKVPSGMKAKDNAELELYCGHTIDEVDHFEYGGIRLNYKRSY